MKTMRYFLILPLLVCVVFISMANAGQTIGLPKHTLDKECFRYVYSEEKLFRQLLDIKESLNNMILEIEKETKLEEDIFVDASKNLLCTFIASGKDKEFSNKVENDSCSILLISSSLDFLTHSEKKYNEALIQKSEQRIKMRSFSIKNFAEGTIGSIEEKEGIESCLAILQGSVM